MSPDVFEDELRTLLHDATDAQSDAIPAVDLGAVLVGGRRVVRRRRVAVVGGTLVVLLVVGGGAWVAVDDGADRAAPVPATRTSVATGPVTATPEAFGDLSGAGGDPVAIPGPQRVSVRLDPTTGEVRYSAVSGDGGRSPLGRSTVAGLDPLGATWSSFGRGSHVLVGVLPADAVQYQLLTPIPDEGGHASTSVTAPLPGTGRQAFAVRFAEAGDAPATDHLVWWDGGDAVHDDSGAVVPSVALGDAARTVVYVAEDHDRFGTFSDRGGQMSMELDGSRTTSGQPVMSSARGDGGRLEGLFVAVVPATSEPGELIPTAGTTVTNPLAKALLPGTDLAVLWSRFSYPDSTTGAGYRSVTWTEDGRTVTETP